MFTASQLISALIKRLGETSVTLTYGETMQFQTKWPTKVEVDDDGTEIILTVDPDSFVTNKKWKD